MKEIKNKPIKDLMKLITEKKESLLTFRFGSAGSRVKNVKEARNLKKDIARIMTEISSQTNESKMIAAEKAGEAVEAALRAPEATNV